MLCSAVLGSGLKGHALDATSLQLFLIDALWADPHMCLAPIKPRSFTVASSTSSQRSDSLYFYTMLLAFKIGSCMSCAAWDFGVFG